MNDLIGQTIGKYQLHKHIGTGGMAKVYKAYQSNLDRYVALKIMHNYLSEQEEFVQRFKREAAAVARLRHSHIVQLHDFDVVDNQHYMVMEFIDGPTLKDELETRNRQAAPFSLKDTAQIMAALTNAVDYAHLRGMVHRDIKPANIMFTSDGHVVLTDFGIVRMIGATYNTTTGFLAGTPAYMSPEQGQGKHGDERSDIYALGIILYEMLTGRPPFDADTPLALIKQHIESPLPPVTRNGNEIPPSVEDVLYKSLAKDPTDRYERAGEIAQALRAAVDLPAEILLQPAPITTLGADDEESDVVPPITPILGKTKAATSAVPYRGLFAFDEKDAPYFFGREAFTEQLLDAVHKQSMVAVLGPSGSGKSSVVRAGLLPWLRQEAGWIILTMRPGSYPFQSLAAALIPWLSPQSDQTDLLQMNSELATSMRQGTTPFHSAVSQILARQSEQSSERVRMLLVVDQFEEIYTLCADSERRQRFLDELLELVDIQRFSTNSSFTLVLTLRTDFLSQALTHRKFADALQGVDVKLGPMNRRELGRAVANPARRQGLVFETGLIARILEDVGNEPGNLPLLEFALTSLWEKRNGRRLTHEAYEAIGEVEGALARHAEEVYAKLTQAEKDLARRVFIQMVAPGSGTEDTRRLATREELGEKNWRLVQKLADARLVVTGQDAAGRETVEVVHEALIRGWARLQEWMKQDRTFRAWQERLRAAMNQWLLTEEDEGALLRGLPLTEAEGWLVERRDYLSPTEQHFIDVSIAAREAERAARERALEEQRRAQEQEKIERQRAEEAARRAEENARNARRLKRLALALVVMMVVAILAAVLAVDSSNRAEQLAATAVVNEQVAVQAQGTAEAEADARATAESEVSQERDAAESARATAEAARAASDANALEAADARATAEASAEELEDALDEARRLSRQAASREVASYALDQLTSDPQLALLLALEAANIPLSEGEEAPASTADALYRALLATQLKFTLSGHADRVTAVAVSPDGSRIATASGDTTAKIWDADNGQERFTLEGHTRAVTTVAFTPDGGIVATGGEEGFIILWDATNGELVSVLDNGASVSDLAISPDGERLAAVSPEAIVRVWSIPARDSRFQLPDHRSSLNAVAYAPDGSRFATAGDDGRVVIWNADTGSPLTSIELELGQNAETEPINELAFSPDGTQLVTAYASGVARVWNATDGAFQFRISGHTSALTAAAFSPDGARLATASADGTAKIWDAASGRALFTLTGHGGAVTAVTFSPDGEQILTASADGTARVWNAERGLFPLILAGHRDAILDIDFSRDGSLVATGSRDQTAHIWNSITGEEIQVFADHNATINAVALHPDGTTLATASDDFNVRLWDLATRELQFLEHLAEVTDVRFSSDGTFLVTGNRGGGVLIWDTATRRVVHRFSHDEPIRTVALSDDDAWMVAGDVAGNIILWDVESETILFTLEGHAGAINDLAFSHDGAWLASASQDNTAKVWNLETEMLARTLSEHTGAVLGVAFSPDDTQLATASADRTAKLWDTATGLSTRTFLGHSSNVHAVTFSPDGTRLATASADRTAQISRLKNLQDLFERGLALIERPLSAIECAQYLSGRPCLTTNLEN